MTVWNIINWFQTMQTCCRYQNSLFANSLNPFRQRSNNKSTKKLKEAFQGGGALKIHQYFLCDDATGIVEPLFQT